MNVRPAGSNLRPPLAAGPLALALAAIALFAALPGAPAGAAPAEFPMRYVTSYRFDPASPDNAHPITFTLLGNYPFACFQIADARVVDPEHVELTVRPGGCGDSAGVSYWEQPFALGYLGVGNHNLWIKLTVERPDSGTVVEEGMFTFGVLDSTYVPPPPPPPPIGSLVTWISHEPSSPALGQPVSVIVHGNFPFDCGQIESATRIDDDHFEISLVHGACSDTVRAWTQPFEMGTLPIGTSLFHLSVSAHGDSAWTESYDFGVTVSDSSAPPPPSPAGLVTSITHEPAAPTHDDPVSVLVSGRFPFICGQIASATRIDDDHFAISLVHGSCSDTTRAWAQSFDLGTLPIGTNLFHLSITAHGDSARTEHYDFSVTVSDTVAPPPVPESRLVIWISHEPSTPGPNDPVAVIVHGHFPFDCGSIASASRIDLDHFEISLVHGSCSDTARAWTQPFNLGTLPIGTNLFHLSVAAHGDSVRTELHDFSVTVSDTIAPPPPDDSLRTVLSTNRPNPFADQTEFSVSLDQPTSAEVAVFDLSGRRVAMVFRGILPRGTSQMVWNGRRSDGSWAPGGIYFYRLQLPNRTIARRVVRLSTSH